MGTSETVKVVTRKVTYIVEKETGYVIAFTTSGIGSVYTPNGTRHTILITGTVAEAYKDQAPVPGTRVYKATAGYEPYFDGDNLYLDLAL